MQTPFSHHQSVTEKVSRALHLPQKHSLHSRVLRSIQHFGLYLAWFVAGFVSAKLHTLLVIAN